MEVLGISDFHHYFTRRVDLLDSISLSILFYRENKLDSIVQFKDYCKSKFYGTLLGHLHGIIICCNTGKSEKFRADDSQEAKSRENAASILYCSRPDIIQRKIWEF